MEIFVYRILSNKCLGRLFKNLGERLFKQGIYSQIQSTVDIALFFNIRQVIEKTTNLHYNLCFIFDHIHSLLVSSSSEGKINGFTASLSSTKIDSREISFCLPASQGCPFLNSRESHPPYYHLQDSNHNTSTILCFPWTVETRGQVSIQLFFSWKGIHISTFS